MTNSDEIDFKFFAEHSVDLIFRADVDARMHYVSPACLRILGWTVQEMTGRKTGEFLVAEDLPVLHAAVAYSKRPGVENSFATARMVRKDGSIIWMEMNARVVRDAATGDQREVIVIARDITDRKQLEEKLSALAHTDGLTGLANRRAFDEALQREWKRTLREGSHMSLLLLDIDRFKQFNDCYGHQVGDDCLRTIAAVVKQVVRREIDVVARYGGEEIVAILPCTGADGALEIAETVRQAIEDLRVPHVGNEDLGSVVTASIGVATALARHGGTMSMPESLLMSADHALYKAKHEGRNRVTTTFLMANQDAASESPLTLIETGARGGSSG